MPRRPTASATDAPAATDDGRPRRRRRRPRRHRPAPRPPTDRGTDGTEAPGGSGGAGRLRRPPTRSSCSCSGSRRPSSPATSPRTTRASTRTSASTWSSSRARRRHRAAAAARRRRRRLRHRLGAQGAGHAAKPGADIVEHRPDLPALGHAAGVVQGRRHHDGRRLRRQEHRQLGLRQRVRDLRRARRRRASTRRSDVEPGRRSSSTWSACSTGDIDAAEAMTYNEYAQVLEADEPRHRRAVHAGGPQRHLLRGRGRRHAAGRHLGRRRQARRRPGVQGHRHALRRRVDPGLGLLPGQPRVVPRHRRRRRLASSAPATSCGR